MRLILAATIVSILWPNLLEAQQQPRPARQATDWTRQEKQAWLYERLVRPVQNPQILRSYTQKLRVMNDAQLQAAIVSYQRQLLYRQQMLQQQVIQQQRWQNNAAVGFRPIVTWLPTGTNFTASAVVSPDRRYVRMSLAPFFSSIPRVDTFNYRTGQARNIYNATPTYTQANTASRSNQVRPRHSWYQKIRTLP